MSHTSIQPTGVPTTEYTIAHQILRLDSAPQIPAIRWDGENSLWVFSPEYAEYVAGRLGIKADMLDCKVPFVVDCQYYTPSGAKQVLSGTISNQTELLQLLEAIKQADGVFDGVFTGELAYEPSLLLVSEAFAAACGMGEGDDSPHGRVVISKELTSSDALAISKYVAVQPIVVRNPHQVTIQDPMKYKDEILAEMKKTHPDLEHLHAGWDKMITNILKGA